MVLFLMALVSCKTQQAVVVAAPEIPKTKGISAEEIIANHYNNKINFETVYIKSNVRFSDEKQTQNVSAEIKIKQDDQILISVRFLGITMAKALITPTSVSYYEKINSTYFEGDFSGLSQWLGTDLDFSKIQNMLLGEAFDNLQQGKYALSKGEQGFELADLKSGSTKKTFFLDTEKFQIQKQEINQPEQERMIQVSYSEYASFNEGSIPMQIFLHTFQPKGKTEISFNYNTVNFNGELSFPYSIPNGYKRIIIK
jgi:DNA-binding protein